MVLIEKSKCCNAVIDLQQNKIIRAMKTPICTKCGEVCDTVVFNI